MIKDRLRGNNKPSPLEATSVAIRMGALPYLNSVEAAKTSQIICINQGGVKDPRLL